MKPLTPLLLLSVAVLAGCSSGGNVSTEPEQPVGPLFYFVSYTVGADQYDDADAERKYLRCADLPGARAEGQKDSLPPERTLRFLGSVAEQEAVVECLDALQDVKVSGPIQPPAQ